MNNEEILKQIRDNNEIISGTDEELKQLAREDNERLVTRLDLTEREDNLPAILEIRAGTGGDEAELFAGDLYRMYVRYANNLGLKVLTLNIDESELGGIKNAELEIRGKQAYKIFHYEAGVHRVQRVPKTEKSGRLHTSAATVAVFPLKEKIEIEIKQEDLRVDVFRSHGKGGQGVNTTDSAVRLTHLPTGMVVTCQDERSQIKNKAKAMQVLAMRLEAKKQEEDSGNESASRRAMIKSGDRSEKIRTYNFPQDRITDHRIEKNFSQIEKIISGNLEPITSAISEYEKKIKIDEYLSS